MGLGSGEVPEEVSIAILCKEMQWDYWTYLRQPAWFVNKLRMMKRVDFEEQKLKDKLDGYANRTPTNNIGSE